MLKTGFKIVYTVVLLLLVVLKADLIAGTSGKGIFPAPQGEAAQVDTMVETMVKPWNYQFFEAAIAPEMKKRLQHEGLNLFYNAVSRKLGYVRELGPAVYVRESLVTQWLNRGRLYRVEAECMQEKVLLEVRVHREAGALYLYEFTVEAASLEPVYDAAIQARQSGIFDTGLFTRVLFAS